jgi:hypothetical protein
MWNKQNIKIFTMGIVLLGFGSMYLFFDYTSIKTKEEKMWSGEYDFDNPSILEHQDPTRFWDISLGDGFISNIEHYIIFCSQLLGSLRLVDWYFEMTKDPNKESIFEKLEKRLEDRKKRKKLNSRNDKYNKENIK